MRARRGDVGLDFFCSNASAIAFGVDFLYRAARATGGGVHCLAHIDADRLAGATVRLLAQRCGAEGEFQVLTSTRWIGLESVVGPAYRDPLSGDDTTFSMRCDRDASVTLFFSVEEAIVADYVYIQLIAARRDYETGRRVLRIVTHRVVVTGSVDMCLSSLDAEVAAVGLAKRAVLDSLKQATGGVLGSRKALRKRLRIILLDPEGEMKQEAARSVGVLGWLSSWLGATGEDDEPAAALDSAPDGDALLAGISSYVKPLAQFMFSLMRGRLLLAADEAVAAAARTGVTADELLEADHLMGERVAFLQANVSDAAIALLPLVEALSPQSTLVEVPPRDLALQSVSIAVVDAGTSVYVWNGRLVLGAQFAAFREYCMSLAARKGLSRIVPVAVVEVTEGTEAASALYARLLPLSLDARAEQLRLFPELASIPAPDFDALVSACRAAAETLDPPSLPAFLVSLSGARKPN